MLFIIHFVVLFFFLVKQFLNLLALILFSFDFKGVSRFYVKCKKDLSNIFNFTFFSCKVGGNSAIVICSTVFTLLGKFAITGSFSTIFLYTHELYPTNMRYSMFLVFLSWLSRAGPGRYFISGYMQKNCTAEGFTYMASTIVSII